MAYGERSQRTLLRRGQEGGQRSHHLLGSLLKTVVAAAGNDHALQASDKV